MAGVDMNLNEAQQKTVSEWIAAGAKLSEVQSRLGAEFGIRLTYMEVRFLVDDLKLRLQDPEPPKPATPPPAAAPASPAAPTAPEAVDAPAPLGGQVSVNVDQIARPGALVSGNVTFSDGMKADWYLDQTGRLGLVAKQQGYKPSPTDVQQFQMALEREMAKMGF
jgi:hypothetical protein